MDDEPTLSGRLAFLRTELQTWLTGLTFASIAEQSSVEDKINRNRENARHLGCAVVTRSSRTLLIPLVVAILMSAASSPLLLAQLPDPAPSSVVVSVTDTTITWTWTAVEGADHYSIWCRDPDGTYGPQYFKCDQTALPTYSVTGLVPGSWVERKVSTNDNLAVTITGTLLTGETTNTGSGSARDFQMAVTPASATVDAGNPANYSITTTPTAGFARKLGFTCSGPGATTCILSPSSVTLDGSTPVTLTVTVSTQARAALRPDLLARPMFCAVMITQLGFGLMGIVVVVGSRRSQHRKVVLICAVLLILAALTACGTGGIGKTPVQGTSGTQAGTFTITITGMTTDTVVPTLSHSVTATLVVR